MQVLKFGGSSVANATAMSRVLDIVENVALHDRVILVSSAISGATDLLIKASTSEDSEKTKLIESLKASHFKIIDRLFTGEEREKTKRAIKKILDNLIKSRVEDYQTYGELLSTTILFEKLRSEGIKTLWINSAELIKCDNGRVAFELSYNNIRRIIGENPDITVFVAPGFIASELSGQLCTLGRGGSDYSAAIYAAALNADALQIWTDVPGIMTTNPKDVKSARTIPEMSYEAAFLLASHGAKVLYAPTVEPAKNAGIDIQILNSFKPEQNGTIIRNYKNQNTEGKWIGIAKKEDGQVSTITIVADGPIPKASIDDIQTKLHKNDIQITETEHHDDYIIIRLPSHLAMDALETLHHFCFEKDDHKRIYLAGEGAVGKALLKIISESDTNIEIMDISRHEIEDERFFENMLKNRQENDIFVDCTDSETIWKWYVPVLEAGINIVSSNRRALSVPYDSYAAMKRSARLNHRFLRYETTVGTALPVLDSIATSAESADTILSIEAIVSCTLNYILTSGLPFKEALKKAQEAKLTEKDPEQDLLGRDATRKLLILAREAGVKLEESDIDVEPVKESKIKEGQRFVAALTRDKHSKLGYKATIKLTDLEPTHPARMLKGTDNMIIIRSTYQPSPLIIQGAGEGAMMAASRILNDILR